MPMSTALTRIPSAASSLDAALVMASPAAREALDGREPAAAARAAIASTLMIEPPPAPRKCGATRRIRRAAATTFRSKSSAHCWSGRPVMRPLEAAPALLTSPSMRCHRSTTAVTKRSMSAALVTSADIAMRWSSLAASDCRARLSRSASRPQIATRAPSSSSSLASAAPRPSLPPVTITTLPCKCRSTLGC